MTNDIEVTIVIKPAMSCNTVVNVFFCALFLINSGFTSDWLTWLHWLLVAKKLEMIRGGWSWSRSDKREWEE